MGALRRRLKARWPGSWLETGPFDASFYRRLLAYCRHAKIPVYALERTPRPPLARRDRRIAARIAELVRQRRDALLVVLVGHGHLLGRGHLSDRLQGLGFRPPLALLPRCRPGTTSRPAYARRPLKLGPGVFAWRDQRPGAGFPRGEDGVFRSRTRLRTLPVNGLRSSSSAPRTGRGPKSRERIQRAILAGKRSATAAFRGDTRRRS